MPTGGQSFCPDAAQSERSQAGVIEDSNEGTRDRHRRRDRARKSLATRPRGTAPLREPGNPSSHTDSASLLDRGCPQRRPLCVTKFGKNMDPSQSFHVCSQLPAEKAKGSLPGKPVRLLREPLNTR
ncbi:uncharacterized protein LOC120892546 [Ictidomys tridecemlineatus]